MKVKVRKHKKTPAPLKMEQVLIKAVASNSPNLYSATQKAIKKNEPFLTNELSKSNRHLKDGIPERAFVDMIDKIYNKVHNPLVKNGPMKYFPDLKISEYINCFDL